MANHILLAAFCATVGVSATAKFKAAELGIARAENTFDLRYHYPDGAPGGYPWDPTSYNPTTKLGYVPGTGYLANIAIGNTTYELVVDTGSSDTWAITANKQFAPSSPINGSVLNITYGDGTNILGTYTNTDVYFNNTLISANQTIGMGTNLTLPGTGNITLNGIVGLAYPELADYNTVNGSKVHYDPIFTQFAKQHPETGKFSLVLDKQGGTLAFGGLPDNMLPEWTVQFVSTPILPSVRNKTGDPNAEKVHDFYTLEFRFHFEGAEMIPGNANDHKLNHWRGIIDSGTSNDWVPRSVAIAVGKLFRPAAKLIDTNGFAFHTVPCNATAPKFAIRVGNPKNATLSHGGELFYYPREEMFMPSPTPGICYSSIVGYPDSSIPPVDDAMIISARFLRQALSVFDVGKGQMFFARRRNYCSGCEPPEDPGR